MEEEKIERTSWEFHIDNQNIPGRPGWHIECSAMSTSHLGQPFDIHTGGIDLTFRIMRTKSHKVQPDAKINFTLNSLRTTNIYLLVAKMSKSLSNFIPSMILNRKGIDPKAFRLMVLQSHYTKQSNFTWDNLQSASSRLKDLKSIADLRWQTRRDPTIQC